MRRIVLAPMLAGWVLTAASPSARADDEVEKAAQHVEKSFKVTRDRTQPGSPIVAIEAGERLALVGDAEGGDVCDRDLSRQATEGVAGALPPGLGILLLPAGPGGCLADGRTG